MKTLMLVLAPLSHSAPRRKHSTLGALALAGLGLLTLLPASTQAGTICKANNDTAMSATGSWTGGVAPTSTDIAGFGCTTFSASRGPTMGSSLSWGGVQITETKACTISSSGGFTLTIGSSGIDGSGEGAAWECDTPLAAGASQTWTGNSKGITLGKAGTGGKVITTSSGANYTVTINSSGTGGWVWINNAVQSGFGGSFTVNCANSGYLELTPTGANNTFSGGITLTAGGLCLDNGTAAGHGTLTINGGTLVSAASGGVTLTSGSPGYPGSFVWNQSFNYGGLGQFTETSMNTSTIGVTLGNSITVTVASGLSFTVGGVIGDGSNGYTLTKAGTGLLALNGQNTFSGGVTLSGGDLVPGNTYALGGYGTTLGTFTINGGTSLDVAGAVTLANYPMAWNGNFTFGTASGYNLNLGAGAVTLGADVQVTVTGGVMLTAGGAISGAHALTKAGANTLTLSGASGYSGGTTLSAGQLNINNSGDGTHSAIGTGTFTISSGTTLDNTSSGDVMLGPNNTQTWNGSFTYAGSVPHNLDLGTGNVTLGASPTVTVSAGTLTVGGVISGAYNLTKAGGGTLTLTGNNTYSGAGGTTVSAGKLVVNGQTGSNSGTGTGAVAVNGGTLSGNGQIGGAVTVANSSSAVFYPNSSATLSLGGNLTFSGSSSGVKFDLSSTAGGANDEVVLANGTLTCGGAQIAINCGATLDTGSDYVLFDVGASGSISGSFNALPTWAGTTPANSGSYSIVTGTRYVTLHYSAAAPPTKLVFTTIPGSGTVGVPFSVTVTAEDSTSTPQNVTSATTVQLGLNSGSGSLSGTLTGTIANGANNVMITTPVYSKADTMSLTASTNGAAGGMNLTAATSGNIAFTEALDWGNSSTGNWTDTGVWYDPNTALSATYSAGDSVLLEDTQSGISPITITLSTAVSPGSLTVNATKNYTISGAGAIGGTIGLTKQNTGSLTLGVANTYTGSTALNGGIVNVDAAETPGTSGPLGASGTISFGGGTLQYSSADTNDYSGRFSTAPGQAYSVDTDGTNATWAAALTSVGGTLTKLGSGTLTLSGANTYTGKTTNNAGTINLGVAENAGVSGPLGNPSPAANSIILNGGYLQYSAANHYDYSSRFSTAASQAYNVDVNAQPVTWATALTSSGGSLTVTNSTGSGALSLTGLNTYSGGTTVNGGQLNINYGAGSGDTTHSAIGTGPLYINGACTIDNTSGGLVSIGPLFALYWNADFTYGGSGALNLRLSSTVTLGANRTVTVNGPSANYLSLYSTIGDGGHGYSLTKAGPGELVLGGPNTFSGGVTLDAGKLDLIAAAALGTGTFTIAGGTIDNDGVSGGLNLTQNNPQQWNGDFTFQGTYALNLGTGGVTLGNSTRQVTVNNSTLTVGGVIGDGGHGYGLTKLGGGELDIGGSVNNTYSGLTTVSAGTLGLSASAGVNAFGGDLTINGGTVYYSAAHDNQIPDTANVTLSSGTLAFGAQNETIGGASAGSFTMTGGAMTIGGGTEQLGRNPVISGGTMTLTAASSVLQANVDLTFKGGTISFNAGGGSPALNLRGGSGTGITYTSDGTSTATINNIGSSSSPVSLNTSGTTTFNIADAAGVDPELDIAVPLRSSSAMSSVTKTGAGKLRLSSSSINFTNGVTISAGTLALGASGGITAASGISIASSATFDVSAVTPSPYHLLTGQTLNGGGATATVNGALTLNSGALLTMTYASGTPTINVTGGALMLNGNATTVTVSGAALGLGSYKLISAGSGGSVAGSVAGSVTVNGSGLVAGTTASLRITSGELWMDVNCNAPTTANAGPNQTFCDTSSATLAANNPTVGQGTWTVVSGSGTFSPDTHTYNATVSGLSYGANVFEWTTHNLSCADNTLDSTSTVTITRNQSPSAPTAGNDSPVYGATLHLTASTVSGATYSWTGPGGFISSAQNPSIAGVTVAAAGTYSVTATVNGCTSSAGTTTVTFIQAGTTNSVAASPNPSLPGADVTFTATLGAVAPGAGIPTGTILFKTNAVALCDPVALDTNGVATLITNSLPHGSNTVTAEYAGDTNFQGSTNSVVQVVNTPPTAADTNAVVLENANLVLSSARLLAEASDPDGDTLSITAAGPTSTNGPTGNVVLDTGAGTITYTPATNYVGSDSFTYTVGDSYGGTASATVYVTVTTRSGGSPSVAVPPSYSDGTFSVTFAGIPNYTYTVQYASDLGGPWNFLKTATADTNGLFVVTDGPYDPQPAARYYRTVYP